MKTTRSNEAFRKYFQVRTQAAQKRAAAKPVRNQAALRYLQDGFESAPKKSFASYSTSAPQVTTSAKQVAAGNQVPGDTSTVWTSNSGAILDAPIQGDPANPSADTYNSVIDQFDVENNPRYAENHQGMGETYCNIFAWDVTRAMGAEIPHYVDPATGAPTGHGGQELDANATNDWLNQHGQEYGWREVSPEEAQALANQGYPAVASWNNPGGIGHIAVVRPGELTADGPEIAQAGATNTNDTHVRNTFHGAQPQYFVNDSGKPAGATGTPPPSTNTPAPSTGPQPQVSGGDALSLPGDPKVAQLVKDAYHTYLRREGDVGGVQNWNAAAQDLKSKGQSDDQIAAYLKDQFTNCPEAQALKLTDQAFQDVLGRDVSDSRGYWHEQAVSMMRDQGKSADETKQFLEDNLKNSKEYALNHVDQVVSDEFQSVLGRPDTKDDYWHQVGRQMVNDGKSLEDVKSYVHDQFVNSDENQLNHPDQMVTSLYHQLLNREPDAGGLKTWTDLANSMKAQGASATDIRNAITDKIKGSAEYQQTHSSGSTPVSGAGLDNLPKTGNEVIDHYAAAAIEAQRETGVPASLALAQLVQESGSTLPLSELATDYHNLFGVKGEGTAGSVTLPTQEYDANGNAHTENDAFARYNNDEESFVAHGELIAGTHPGWKDWYAKPWAQYQQDHDAYGLARGIAGIYATDPNYANSLVAIMQKYNLTQFDALA